MSATHRAVRPSSDPPVDAIRTAPTPAPARRTSLVLDATTDDRGGRVAAFWSALRLALRASADRA